MSKPMFTLKAAGKQNESGRFYMEVGVGFLAGKKGVTIKLAPNISVSEAILMPNEDCQFPQSFAGHERLDIVTSEPNGNGGYYYYTVGTMFKVKDKDIYSLSLLPGVSLVGGFAIFPPKPKESN
jgi:hypothetical protein